MHVALFELVQKRAAAGFERQMSSDTGTGATLQLLSDQNSAQALSQLLRTLMCERQTGPSCPDSISLV